MYLVVYPHSNGNPTDKHRVVDCKDWMGSWGPNGVRFESEHSTYKAADRRRNELNGELTSHITGRNRG